MQLISSFTLTSNHSAYQWQNLQKFLHISQRVACLVKVYTWFFLYNDTHFFEFLVKDFTSVSFILFLIFTTLAATTFSWFIKATEQPAVCRIWNLSCNKGWFWSLDVYCLGRVGIIRILYCKIIFRNLCFKPVYFLLIWQQYY